MKLTHLEHIEDNLMEYPEKVQSILTGIGQHTVNFSLKYDGAPSIIFGIDPFEDKFFLSTKSLFNKSPKVNYSCSDIMKNHGDNYPLACKLMYAFTLLKAQYKDSIIVQADLLFCNSEVDYKHSHPRFTPNTLTYEVQGENVKDALLGLAVHTQYNFVTLDPMSLQDMTASPYHYTGSMGDKIWIARTEVQTQNFTFEVTDALECITQVLDNRDKQFVQTRIIDTGLYADYKIFYNSCIRNMDLDTSAIEYDTHWQRFVNWSIDRTTAQIKKLKTPSSMKAHLYKLDERLVLLYDTKVIAHFKDMIQARDKINKVKNNVTQELQYASPVCALFEGVYCGHEGYVVTSPSGDMMKIVNRREFSARNFNKNKGGSFENNSR